MSTKRTNGSGTPADDDAARPAGAGAPAADRPARRSQAWFGASGRAGMIHRSWMRNRGYGDEMFDGRPVIGIATTWSQLAPCNSHLDEVAEAVKRGVLQAGGFPLEFPVLSTGETIIRPTAMLFRNLMAMDAEELIRNNPLDGVVLLSGCDKTTPGLLMGAASVNLPAIMVTGGPMLNGKFRGQDVGSGTHVWKFEAEMAAGRMSECESRAAEGGMARSKGHCMTMGTASTMACMAEALGMQLPGGGAYPAVDARRFEVAQESGRRIVDLVERSIRPSDIMTREAFENAIRANAAIGGSTNAFVHLMALAGRIDGVELDLDLFDALGREVPTLVNLMPSGRYLMEDFCYAGGLPVVLRRLIEAGMMHPDCLTVTGRSVGENVVGAECFNDDVIRPFADPYQPRGTGTAVLRGNLCPDGAVLKQSAASPQLLVHEGTARVFDSPEAYHAVSNDPDLDIAPEDVIVVRGAGPKGYPGMPEVANVALPAKLLKQGVTDMVRISDGRMSGTGYGTVVLHISPEAAVGGPLSLVREGDRIRLDVPGRELTLLVDDAELDRRRARARDRASAAGAAGAGETAGGTGAAGDPAATGYTWLYRRHVQQAHLGADFDFLTGTRGHAVPRDSH
jgi:dihydroxy-acid dehydratase